MYSVHDHFKEDPSAQFLCRYGRSLHKNMPDLDPQDVDRLHKISTRLSSNYIQNCEDAGLDPRSDILRVDYLLFHSQNTTIRRSSLILTMMLGLVASLEPMLFDDDNYYYYILGKIATEQVIDDIAEMLEENPQ